ncbi:MAG: hypothetical protein USCAAHI_00126 [Beijerinckiaceae bacterium]|nr:MAG: hypothetical protein USCAAHI_00126 [Beijerinckiaceae bacterium]
MADTNAPLPLLPAHCDRRRAEAAWHSGGEPSDRPDGLFDTTAFTGPPRSIGVLTVIAAGWISLNLPAPRHR